MSKFMSGIDKVDIFSFVTLGYHLHSYLPSEQWGLRVIFRAVTIFSTL